MDAPSCCYPLRSSPPQTLLSMARQTTTNSLTLHTIKLDPFTQFKRLHILLYSLAILALFYHHVTSILSSPYFLSSSLLLFSDLILAFMWALSQAFRWRSIRRHEYPDRLVEVVADKELPALDVFICTADPWKEPLMSVLSTALSVMAFDYPAEKLSVYVSDDGGSDMTLFAFMEAARFARYWLPFCRENGVDMRSPEAYFESNEQCTSEETKRMYHIMKEKVESAMKKGFVCNDLINCAEEYDVLKKWKRFTRANHPSVIQVLLESNKDTDIMGNSIPNLVYVSREKSPTSPHNFKAGALNALVRVSSVMTNAPIILTLDCDMYSNDPRTPHRALCYFLDPEVSGKLAFIQFPQRFKGINKNDTYGSEMKQLFIIHSRGMDGLHGPNYVGTGCFFSRRCLYGPSHSSSALPQSQSSSIEPKVDVSLRLESVLKSAHEASACNCEVDTEWGSTIGFRYGSLVEDYYTGYRLHCEGWQSVFCDPERPAFLGDVPKNLNDVLSQCKRWCVGLYEVGLTRYCPLFFGTRRASFLMGLCYAYYAFWGIWCIPITTYGLVPSLALIFDVPLFPKVSDPWFYLYTYLFLAAYGQYLLEFLATGGTIQRWWTDQRIWMIRSITSLMFGTFQFTLNQIGISAPGFNVTSKFKEDDQSESYEKGDFYLGIASPFFVPLGVVAIVNLGSFILGIMKIARKRGDLNEMFVQLFLSGFVVANSRPIIEAMFVRRDGGRMPRNVTNVSILLAGTLSFIGCILFTN